MKKYIFHPGVREQHTCGSLTHFYHFLYGIYLPLIYQLEDKKQHNIIVPSCGPMNKHLTSLKGYNINIESPSTLALLNYPTIMCEPWDTFNNPAVGHMSNVTNDMFNTVNDRINNMFDIDTGKKDIDILFINRDVSTSLLESDSLENINHEYITHIPSISNNKTSASGNIFYEAGACRRSISNVMELVSQLCKISSVMITELSNLTIREQFELFSRAKVIIGQHGAGLSHVFRANHKSLVIEILPIDMHKTCFKKHTMFEQICKKNFIKYVKVLQTTGKCNNKKITLKEAWSETNPNNHAPVTLDDTVLRRIKQHIK